MSEEKIKEKMKAMVNTAPRTVGELHDKLGEKFNLSRSQVDHRLTSMVMEGKFKGRKPKQRASKIFYRSDYTEKNKKG